MVMSSVSTPVSGAADARFRYVSPAKFWGTVQAPFTNGEKAAPPGWPPLVNAQKAAPVAVVLSWRTEPAAIAEVDWLGSVMVIAGKAVMARLEPVGQESMNPAARVKTLRIPSGVSNAEGTAATLEAVRMKV